MIRWWPAGAAVRWGSCAPLLLCFGLTANLGAETRHLAPTLEPFASCRSVAGATLVRTTPLVTAPSKRTVQTLQGDKQVDIADGARLIYTLNGYDYAYLRVEQLPSESYLQGKADLLSNFKRLISGDELAFPADALAEKLLGFLIVGENHKQMLGQTLGIYLLIDDRTQVVTTIYFQNADEAHHAFTDMSSYATLRDSFLISYTSCVRGALRK